MYTEMRKAISAADEKVQYDESAKRLLAQKYVLAHILAKCIDEFYGMKPEDIVPYIEGEPQIGIVPVEAGLTNKKKTDETGQRIVGFNTENAEINEGLIRFDILFYVRLKEGLSKIIINVEAQKSEPTSYKILNRAIFYVSRLVSSQKERDFVKSNYNDIKKVYSIWICMNMDVNCMTSFRLTKKEHLEKYDWGGDPDLLNIILIGITNNIPKQEEKYTLHRLLAALLANHLSEKKRLEIIENEYEIPLTENERKEVKLMCNLSEGIEEKGVTRGKTEMIVNMYKRGYSLKQIAEIAEMECSTIQEIIKKENTD